MGKPTAYTLITALAGGLVFEWLQIPLSWLLGPMTAVLIWREFFGGNAEWHTGLRNTGLVALGYMMGITFTAQVAAQIARQLPAMAAATVLTVAFGMAAGWVTARQTGLSVSSGIIGSIPGGLTQMIVLSGEVKDADVTVVTFMQTIRLMSVIFIVPFLAVHGMAGGGVVAGTAAATNTHQGISTLASGSIPLRHVAANAVAVGLMVWLSPRLKLPTPYLLGPLAAAALLSVSGLEAPALPHIAIVAAQIMVGTHMGLTTRISSLSNWRKLLPYSLAGGVGIVLFSMAVGWGLKQWHPVSFATAFLGTAPGGMTEMGLTGAAVHADLSVIVAYQMFRILFILFLVPPLVKVVLRLHGSGKPRALDAG